MAELSRILFERDEALRYSWDNREDGTGLGPIWPSCGCRPGHDCDWHQHVAESVEQVSDIVTSYERTCIPGGCCDWSAHRKDYDGAPDSHCHIGFGRTEHEAISDLLEKEE